MVLTVSHRTRRSHCHCRDQQGSSVTTYGKPARHFAAELTALRIRYPQFAIWQEVTGHRIRYVARREPAGHGLHTLVTADLGELAKALAQAYASPAPPQPAG